MKTRILAFTVLLLTLVTLCAVACAQQDVIELLPGVVDLSDEEITYQNGLVIPADTDVDKNSIVYTPQMDAGAYRITSLQKKGDTQLATVEAVDATQVFESLHVEVKGEPMSVLDIQAPEGVTIQDVSDIPESKEIKLSLKYDVDNTLYMDISVVYSAVVDAVYDYEQGSLPEGDFILTETISVKGSLKLKTSTSGSIKQTLLELPKLNKPYTANEDSLLKMTLGGKNLVTINGGVTLSLSAALAGNVDYTCRTVKGVRINGSTYETVNRTEVKNCKELSVSGTIDLMLSANLGMSVPLFGTVASLNLSAGVGVNTEQCEQYDEYIGCHDVALSFKGSMSMTVKLGVSVGSLSMSFITKNVPIVHFENEVARWHLEAYFVDMNGKKAGDGVKFLRECSVPETVRKTVRFYTGTLQKIDNANAVTGATFKKPNDPVDISQNNRFQGWYTALEGGELFDFGKELTEQTPRTTTLYAHWSMPYRKLTIDMGYDGKEPVTTDVQPDTFIAQPTLPLRMNYRFDGFWYATQSSSGYVDNQWDFLSMPMPNRDLTLVAKWTYEEGYNPAMESVNAVINDENAMEQMQAQLVAELKSSTGLQALGIDDPMLEKLRNFYFINGYTGSSDIVVIPEKIGSTPVVYVNGSTFANKENIRGLVLPSTVMAVEGFRDYPNLQFVIFGSESYEWVASDGSKFYFSGVVYLGNSAFYNCNKLEIASLPSTVRYIHDYAFARTSITYVSMGIAKMEVLGKYAFAACPELLRAELPAQINRLSEGLFCNCPKLATIQNIEALHTLGEQCLRNTGITGFTLSNIQSIGNYAFADCAQLETLRLGFADAMPGNYSFGAMPALTNLTIMSNVNGAFTLTDACPKLQTININGNVEGKLRIGNHASLKSVVVMGTVQSMALNDLPLLNTIAINEITGVFKATATFGGQWVEITLQNCQSLRTIAPPMADGMHIFTIDNCGMQTLDLNALQADVYSVHNMPELTSVTLPSGVYEIPEYAFEGCSALRSINIRPAVASIGNYAFKDCTALRSVVVPSTVLQVGTSLFQGCTSLEKIVWQSVGTLESDIQIGRNCAVSSIELPMGYEEPSVGGWGVLKNLTRLVVPDVTTEVSYYVDGSRFVLVTPTDSPMWEVDSYNSTPAACGACMIPYGSQEADMYVVRFKSGGVVHDANAYSNASAGTLYMLYNEGDVVRTPAYTAPAEDDGSVFAGWYLDEACTQPMPVGMTMPARDLNIYGAWRNVNELFEYTTNNGTATITRYVGNESLVIVPERLEGYTVTDIANGAFAGQNVTDVRLPSGIQSVSPLAFANASALRRIEIDNESFVSVDGVVYARAQDGRPLTLLVCPSGYEGVLNVPQSVTSVGIYAAAYCSHVTQVCFTQDVTLADFALPMNTRLVVLGPVEAPQLIAWAEANGVSYNEYTIEFAHGDSVSTMYLRAGTSLDAYTAKNTAEALFVGWTRTLGSTELMTQMPAEDVRVYAVWRTLYTVENGVLTAVDDQAGTQLYIPQTVQSIAAGAVQHAVESAYIPASVTTIVEGAFANVSLIKGDANTEAQRFATAYSIPFESMSYTLAFETNGGAPVASVTGSAGAAITLPTPIRTQANFIGWYQDEALTTAYTQAQMPACNMTLYAAWELMPGYEMDFTYRYNDDGTVTLTGYTGSSAQPTVPDTINGCTVTAIAEQALRYQDSIVTLRIPASVQTVGAYAFADSALRTVTFEGQTTIIGQFAFENCTALGVVTLPQGLQALPEGLFAGCTSLVSATLPDSVATIGNRAFDGCTYLQSLALPASLEALAPGALEGLWLTEISVSSSNTHFVAANQAVYTADGSTLLYLCKNTDATTFTVPEGVTEIAPYALNDCVRIRTLTLPEGLVTLGESALSNICVDELTLPQSLKTIGDYALNGAPYLLSLSIPDGVQSIGEQAFDYGTALYVSSKSTYAYGVLNEDYTVLVYEQEKPIQSIALAYDTLTLKQGEQTRLRVQLTPADATESRIYMGSTDPDIALYEDGVVTAVAPGTAIVYALTPNGLSAACTVTVEDAPIEQSDVPIIDNPYMVMEDGTYFVTHYGYYTVSHGNRSDFTLSDTSGKLSFRSYDDFSVPIGVDDGTEITLLVTVRAGTENERIYPLKLMVVREQYRVSLPASVTLFEGDSTRLTGGKPQNTVLGKMGAGLYCEDESVATIDENGILTALKPGYTAIYYDAFTFKEKSVLYVKPSSCTITASCPDGVVARGETKQLIVTCSDPDATLVYTSSNPDIISVNNGSITGVKIGSASISIAAVKNGKAIAQSSLHLKSLLPFDSLNITKLFDTNYAGGVSVYTMQMGEKVYLLDEAQVPYADAASVRWSVEPENIVTIDDEGYATAVGIGKVTITGLRLGDGVTESVEVWVDYWDDLVKVLDSSLSLPAGQSTQLRTVCTSNDPRLTIEYESDNPDTVSVSDTGLVTALQESWQSTYVSVNLYNVTGHRVMSTGCHVSVDAADTVYALENLPEKMEVVVDKSVTCISSENYLPAGGNLWVRSYTSANPEIATIQMYWGDMTVTGISPGNTTVTVTLRNGTSYTIPVSVSYPAAYAKLNAPTWLCAGDSATVSVTNVQCKGDYTVAYSVKNQYGNSAAWASIDQKGVLKALGSGSVRLTYTITDKETGDTYEGSKLIEILSEPYPAVSAEDLYVVTRDDFSVHYIPLTTDGEISNFDYWYEHYVTLSYSANPVNTAYWRDSYYYAPVLKYGAREGEWEGDRLYLELRTQATDNMTFTIEVDNGGGREKSRCTFDVVVCQDTAVSTNLEDFTAAVGYTTKLTPEFVKERDWYQYPNLPTTWSSNNASVASITEDGVLTANAVGTAVLTATSTRPNGETLTCSATVTVIDAPLTAAAFTEPSVTIKKEDTYTLTWTIEPNDGRAVCFTSSDPTVATVDAAGVVEGISKGTTTITMSGGNGVTASCQVTVEPIVESVLLTPNAGNFGYYPIALGQSIRMQLNITPADASNTQITWETYPEGMLYVSEDGVVTALRTGWGRVTAYAGDESDHVEFIIFEGTGEITASPSATVLAAGEMVQLAIADAKGNPVGAQKLLFTSQNTSVATVDNKGVVTAQSNGQTNITVETMDGTGKATVQVVCRGEHVTLTLPTALQEVDEEAFMGATFFTRVDLGANVDYIGKRAFADCPALLVAVIRNPDAVVDKTAFEGCPAGVTVYCVQDSSVWQQAQQYGWDTVALP